MELTVLRVKGGPRKVAMLFGEHARELISPEVSRAIIARVGVHSRS